MDEFAIQEAHREQMKQRVESLFQTLDDAPLQANLDELDRIFSTLKHQIQVKSLEAFRFIFENFFQHRYETLNRAAHHHADYDLRFQGLVDSLSSLQTRFYQIRQEETNSDVLIQLKVNILFFHLQSIDICR